MPIPNLTTLIQTALAEDIGSGDITSELLIPEDLQAELLFVAREKLVVCGGFIAEKVYAHLCHPERSEGSPSTSGDPSASPQDDIRVETILADGHHAKPGDIIARAKGDARILLTGERVALNLMQRMSGVATLTKKYVDAIAGTQAKILDTRKTIPGMREADKYAVRIGGGMNHRMRLDDAILVKDNHIGIRPKAKGISDLVAEVRHSLSPLDPRLMPIIVECDTLDQLREILPTKPDRIMLDNMSLDQLREAVSITAGAVPLEATGGVNLATIQAIAQTGVDYISVGAITHSAHAVDIGADIVFVKADPE